jgi:siderophore synthetase component
MKLEIKDSIGVKKAIIFVINDNNRIYQIHRIEYKWGKNNSKIIDINENDIVVEYAIKYDFKENKLRHLMVVIYHPEQMSENEAFNKAKNVIARYLEKQVKMGVNLQALLGG